MALYLSALQLQHFSHGKRSPGIHMIHCRTFISGLLLLVLMLPVSSRIAAQAIADDEILPTRHMPDDTRHPDKTPAGEVGTLSAVTAVFVKKDEVLPAGVMFFNVFKIQNTSAAPVSFLTDFSIPAGTNLMIQEADQGELLLNPGESKFMPVRVSFPVDAAGGVPYEIIAGIKGLDGQQGVQAKAIVEFERTSRWQISTPMSKVYASSVSTDYTAVRIFLSNKGNASENLNLLCEAGELLKMEDEINGTRVIEVGLRPSTDTVIILNVRSKPFEGEGSAGDRARLVVHAKNHPDSAAKEIVVIFDTKDGTFRNENNDESPLTLRFEQGGIGGDLAATSIGVSGTILYKDERAFRYEMNTQQQLFGAETGFDPLKNTQLRVGYESPEYALQAGYSGGSLGLSYQRTKEDRSYRTAVIHNFNTGAWDLSGGYQQQLSRKISGKTSAIVRTDKSSGNHSATADVGANIALSEGQRLSFKTTGTYAHTTHESGKTFDNAGLAYELDYGLELGRLKLNASNSYASKNYAGSDRGTFKIDADAVYELKPGQFLKLAYATTTKKTDGLSKEGTIANAKNSRAEKLAANYNFSVGNMPFALGAVYGKAVMSNDIYSLDTTVASISKTYGFTAGTTISSKKNGDFSLSPSVKLGMAQLAQGTWQDAIEKPTTYNATMSLKGRIKQANISADYEITSTSGQTLGEAATVNKRVQLASNYLFPLIVDKLSLRTSGEVAYDMTNKEMKTQGTASLEYESGRNWSFHVSTNFDPQSMVSGKSKGGPGSVSVGASRSFDIPQPRLRYYNLQVVFFKDFNGNRLLDDEDEGISNVLVEIERVNEPVETAEGIKTLRFEAPSLMSDPEGKVIFQKAPQGNYLLKLEELFPRMAYTNLYGATLDVTLNKHVMVLVPYTESVMIVGKVDITRDKYSRLVGVNAKNIRITVTDPSGDQYHSLTGPNGDFIVSVPYAEHYKISMNNVLGDKFDLTNGEQELDVEKGTNRYTIGFLFKEKGRSVNFGAK